MARDYYEILEVEKKASAEEIKRSFRRLARQYHPDVNKESDAEAKFKEINEAYQVLSNPQKRSQYDYFGKAGAGAGPGMGGFDFSGFETNFEGFGDVFDMFFGGGARTRQRTGPQRGEDLRYDVSITLEEASKDTEIELEIPHMVTCDKCKGSGAEPGSKPKQCPTCHGSGQVKTSQRTILGSFTRVVPCPKCKGQG